MWRRFISCGMLAIGSVLWISKAASAQPISNNPGVILEGTAGRSAYTDDSGSVNRREFRVRAGYRLCPYCAGFGRQFRLMPFISLGISDLAGLSHSAINSAAIGSLDGGLAAVLNVSDRWRLEPSVATGLKRTAERLTSVGNARDFVNFAGSGGQRLSIQVNRLCIGIPLLGRRTVVAGLSSARGHYDSREIAGETVNLPRPTNYKSTTFWVGLQSRTLLSDCAG